MWDDKGESQKGPKDFIFIIGYKHKACIMHMQQQQSNFNWSLTCFNKSNH